MYDRRIARGSTHAAMVIPAGSHPDALFMEKKQERKKRKMQQKVGSLNNLFSASY
jgi:hypothetical protein